MAIHYDRMVMTISEQKQVMLEILLKFSEFCEENGLRYFLDAGTLIGAVRHKGFIPWDDDIDVCMPREDFDIFLRLMNKQQDMLDEHLYIERPENIMYPFIKIADDRTILIEHPKKHPEEVGVYIDVFPKDGIFNEGNEAKIVCKVSELFELLQWFNNYSIYAWKNDPNLIKKSIAWLGRRLIHHPNWGVKIQNKIIRAYIKKYPYDSCEFVTTLVRGEYRKRAPRECFSDYIIAPFEKYKFRIPVGYDTYLRRLYKGDYMELPPEEQRTNHGTIIYWKSDAEKCCFIEEKGYKND